MATFLLTDLRGGMSDHHPASLPDNQVASAYNISYGNSMLGGRRNGSTDVVPILSAITIGIAIHRPSSDPAADEYWMITEFGAIQEFRRFSLAFLPVGGTLVTPTPADVFQPAARLISTADLHGKLFLAIQNSANRLHVWDGTVLRRVGLAPPTAAPTVTNTGVGTFSTTRYYRTRFLAEFGVTILRKSEPSAQVTFVPNGTSIGAAIARPALIGEGETGWAVEESINNADWYDIAHLSVATTTYTDSLAATAVATTGTLAAAIGAYAYPRSPTRLVVDRDRLVMFGDHTDPARDSDMVWTPVGSDSSGVGNDERVPASTVNTLRLDAQEGGGITDAIAYDTQILAFKRRRVYLMTHTGQTRQAAYSMNRLSATFGALRDSVIEFVDAQGRACIYFFDPVQGPMSYGAEGFRILLPHLKTFIKKTFDTRTAELLSGARSCAVTRVASLNEVWWALPPLGAAYPLNVLVYNTETGGATVSEYPFQTTALAVDATGFPLIAWYGPGATAVVVRGNVEGALDDIGHTFRGRFTTRAYRPTALMAKFMTNGAVLEAQPSLGVTITVKMIRDYGLETKSVAGVITASGSGELYVIVPMDDATLSECTSLQLEIGDATSGSIRQWFLECLGLKYSDGTGNAGR